jgi:hypothetical protein
MFFVMSHAMDTEIRWREVEMIEPSFSHRVACNANCVLIADIGTMFRRE